MDIHTFHSYLYYILGENNKDLIKNRERESPNTFEVINELIKYGEIKEIVVLLMN
ncbi:hypothetical protein [Lebetimonas sp. JH292]|uniref:hypothetical protein n=1 Tax=Lebetimonas sp. JH292 TaxID=990068 RepID=UPI0004B606C0|nr:hypothetical protein [Lebetimonas sp. JH292]